MEMPKKHSIFTNQYFGGEFSKIMRFKDISGTKHLIAENEANKIMLLLVPIGEKHLMANDFSESMANKRKRKQVQNIN